MPTLKPYPAYADTDLPWLPKIPKHWEVKRLKQVADVAFSSVDKHSKEDEQSVLLCNYIDVYKNEQITHDLEFMQATASSDEIKRFTLREGDVMITKDSESWNDIAVPAYVSEDLDNILCGYHLALLRPKRREIDGKFLFRALQTRPISYQFEVEATGITRYGIDQYAISSTYFPIPPLPEQRTIAAYLDRQTAKIDALIAKKQRLLDLLSEQRAALISQAVTKGLNPAVKMKDSGVAWLGQVPSHWEVSKLGYVSASIQTGPFGSQIHSNEYVTGGIPLINPAHIKDGKIYPSEDVAVDQKTWHALSRHELLEGDIIFARRGEMGRCALVTETESGWLCGTGSIRLRLKKSEIFPKYLSWVLSTKGISDYLLLESVGTTMDNLNTKILAAIPLSVPPIKEQVEISEYLDYQTNRLSNLATKVDNVIARLQEYRAALISSVVTGKVDVRNYS